MHLVMDAYNNNRLQNGLTLSKHILLYCVIFSSAVLLIAGCEDQSRATSEQIIKRAKLVFDLESYVSPEEARQHLGKWKKNLI